MKASLPGWIKNRLENFGICASVDPYVSTHHNIAAPSSFYPANSEDVEDEKLYDQNATLYERCEATYDNWITQWCKRLVQLSQPTEKKLFWASEEALASCPQVTCFLLPYMIKSVLRSRNSHSHLEIKREIMSVLANHYQSDGTYFGTTVCLEIEEPASQSHKKTLLPSMLE